MKNFLLLFLLFLVCSFSQANASNYEATASGPFIIISQKGFSENNIISIRKSSVISAQLDEKKIILITSAIEIVKEYKNGKERKIDRSISYTFVADTKADAKKLFEFIMKELDS